MMAAASGSTSAYGEFYRMIVGMGSQHARSHRGQQQHNKNYNNRNNYNSNNYMV